MAEANAKFEYPDPSLYCFPFPNTPAKLRSLAMVCASDLVRLRAAAGRIIKVTDPLVSDRVFSHRLQNKNGDHGTWTFKKLKNAHRLFRSKAVTLLRDVHSRVMCRTDVKRYYASIQADLLEAALLSHGCDVAAVALIIRCLNLWHQGALVGLPIGTEASAVLGNFFLTPVDDIIAHSGCEHVRWGDDILFFAETASISDAMRDVVDEQMALISLSRSDEKTRRFDDPKEAIAEIEDTLLTSFEGFFGGPPSDFKTLALRAAFDREIRHSSDVSRRRFHWFIRALTNTGDTYGCAALADSDVQMNIDPKDTGDYLSLAVSDPKVVVPIMSRLGQPPEDKYEGLAVHLLRAMSYSPSGKAEGKAFESIATDLQRRPPIRSWAFQAYANSAARCESVLMEAAREELDPTVRRSIVAALRRSPDSRRRRTFIRHATRHFRESRFTAEWLRTA